MKSFNIFMRMAFPLRRRAVRRWNRLKRILHRVVCGDLVANGKPAPDIFLLAAERIGISPADCYVFEDGYNGLRGASAAGCAPVMIPDTMPATDEMRAICMGIYPSLSAALADIQRGTL